MVVNSSRGAQRSRRRRVWNQGVNLAWNHREVMYVINPKERYTLRVMPYAYGNYTLAHARLHTNPSDWIEKSKPFDLHFSCVTPTISNLMHIRV